MSTSTLNIPISSKTISLTLCDITPLPQCKRRTSPPLKNKINKRLWSIMMTSSSGNIFRFTDPLCGVFTGRRWIPLTKASDAELCVFSYICAWTIGWVNNRDTGVLRHHRAHHDVMVFTDYNVTKTKHNGPRAQTSMAAPLNFWNGWWFHPTL